MTSCSSTSNIVEHAASTCWWRGTAARRWLTLDALELGARDYLVKPFIPGELITRLNALIADAARASTLPAAAAA
jgi:hypothetical protein